MQMNVNCSTCSQVYCLDLKDVHSLEERSLLTCRIQNEVTLPSRCCALNVYTRGNGCHSAKHNAACLTFHRTTHQMSGRVHYPSFSHAPIVLYRGLLRGRHSISSMHLLFYQIIRIKDDVESTNEKEKQVMNTLIYSILELLSSSIFQCCWRSFPCPHPGHIS